MGCADGSDNWSSAVCLRRRDDIAFAAMAMGWYEHGKCGSVHDNRTCYKNNKSWRIEDRYGVEEVRTLHCICDVVIVYNGNGNQFDNKLLGIKFWMDSKKEVSYGF